MARVQTAEAMGNIQFDPGIAQSVLTNKEMQSRERTAMAQMDTQKQISAGDQAASMSNAGTQANASMFNTAQGIAGEQNMQSQRLAAQAGAQQKQMDMEKWMKMKDDELAQSMTSERSNLEVYLQKNMQGWQDDVREDKWKKGLEITKLDQQWATKMAMFTARVRMGMLKSVRQQGGSTADIMKMQDESDKRGQYLKYNVDTVGTMAGSIVDPKGDVVNQAIQRRYIMEAMDPANKDFSVVKAKAKEITSEMLTKTGIAAMGWSVDDWMGPNGALSAKILEKLKSGKMQPVEVASMQKAAGEILSKLKDVKDDKILGMVRDNATGVRMAFTAAGLAKDKTALDILVAGSQIAQGVDPDMQTHDAVNKGMSIPDFEQFLNDEIKRSGLSFGDDSETGQAWNLGIPELERQLGPWGTAQPNLAEGGRSPY
jgi:hypothetical protein